MNFTSVEGSLFFGSSRMTDNCGLVYRLKIGVSIELELFVLNTSLDSIECIECVDENVNRGLFDTIWSGLSRSS